MHEYVPWRYIFKGTSTFRGQGQVSNIENVNNPTPDYLMNGDDADSGAGLIDSGVLPTKTTISSNEKILDNNN